jgi:hypothetical protein
VAFFDTQIILILASKAFAFYYTWQYMAAFNVSGKHNQIIGNFWIAVVRGYSLSA